MRGREHSAINRAMKPISGSASLAAINWSTWSAKVKWWRARGVNTSFGRAFPLTRSSFQIRSESEREVYTDPIS